MAVFARVQLRFARLLLELASDDALKVGIVRGCGSSRYAAEERQDEKNTWLHSNRLARRMASERGTAC